MNQSLHRVGTVSYTHLDVYKRQVKTRVGQSAMLDYFDRNLLNSDGTLRLNRSGSTDVRLQNGQRFLGTLGNQLLLVLYGATDVYKRQSQC